MYTNQLEYLLTQVAFFIRTPLFWQGLLVIGLAISCVVLTIMLIKLVIESIVNTIKNILK